MRSLAGSASLAVLLLVVAPAAASSSLVLTDGQVIKGIEVKRQGDAFLVTMAGGNTVAFPAALVKEVKLEEDPPVKALPRLDESGPRTLVGPGEFASQDRKDQLKVFGPPTRWSKDAVDTTWVPTSAFDPDKDVLAGSRATWSKSAVDTTWTPQSVFDLDKDVLAGSRATWSKSVVDTTWKPKDEWGFRPLSSPGTSPDGTAPYSAASVASVASDISATPSSPAAPAPWSCAERLFATDKRSPSMDLRSLKSTRYASLGLPLYEASGIVDGNSRKAVFTIAGDECRLVGGDADVLIGLNLSSDHAMAQDAASFNAAMAARGGARVPSGVGTVDYALAFQSLTDPRVSGSAGATLKLIAKPEELRSIAEKAPAACALSKAKRRKEERAAIRAFATPKTEAGKDGDVVTFLTWSSAGGTVYRNTVVLARGGVVSAKRDTIASHLGAHQE
jgi:hypothetical protein